MGNQLSTIRLYGEMGARFGRVHHLAVDSCAEAISALSAIIPGFDQYMRDSQSRGLTFAPFIGKRNIGFNEMSQPIPDGEEFRIAPIIIGNKKGGLFQTILGAAMIVAGVVASFIPGGQAVSPYLVAAGISTAAGGVMQMLSPQATGMKIRENDANAPSYAFGQPVNTTAQGNIVGVLYGEREIGGAIISAGIIANEVRS
ncbi:tail assembly protein [Klebsiella phage phiKp_7-1]|nr:tail assembly protein I [Klebsiella phage vB_Kp3]BEH84549.1 tail assembly protein [Klebsiella phage phiKp_7-1]BEH89092.1 tail assembly protein [Klebsiella phage phiKp_24]